MYSHLIHFLNQATAQGRQPRGLYKYEPTDFKFEAPPSPINEDFPITLTINTQDQEEFFTYLRLSSILSLESELFDWLIYTNARSNTPAPNRSNITEVDSEVRDLTFDHEDPEYRAYHFQAMANQEHDETLIEILLKYFDLNIKSKPWAG